ncbi:ATP-dependent DNA/RNA helicase [Lobaria immixta]|nr:ATP-dependent DNA/RNA helicase [Lobaria immixta]
MLAEIHPHCDARTGKDQHNSPLSVQYLAHLVVDEGDLVMGYGFKEDLEQTAQNVPKGAQIFLMSATLHIEVKSLGSLRCTDLGQTRRQKTERGAP